MAHSVAGISIKNSHPVWDIGQFGKFGHENTLVESGPGRCTRLHGVQTNTLFNNTRQKQKGAQTSEALLPERFSL